MSNVANLELCKELYAVSGWEADYWYDWNHGSPTVEDMKLSESNIPAYDLGYLLRKLPKWLGDDSYLQIDWSYVGSRDFCMGYMGKDDWTILVTSKKWHGLPDNEPNGRNEEYVKYMSPESLAAVLSIELFKQHILRKEQPHEG